MANDKKAEDAESNESNEKKAKEVIDSFCSKKEESYDQFMKSFTTLNKEDVLSQLMKDVGNEMMNEPIQNKDKVTKKTITFKDKKTLEIDDDIEAEVLLEGTPVGSMSANKRPTRKKPVQFGNFVDELNSDVEDDGIDGLEEIKYVASFSQPDKPTEMDLPDFKDSAVPLHQGDEKLIPGEADEVDTSLHPVTNATQLDLSSRLQSSLNQTNITDFEVTSDDVIAFTLDEEFDYNNVVLTPKWTGRDRPPGFVNGT
ncbi:intraflagellar transport-associated protein-like [Antedon mediterranea]|uniref:intraflagellar transport-associated protein-like n=1 Tax=Antedon mediterranea TaxID=105859 RepID=UPI003AF6C46C